MAWTDVDDVVSQYSDLSREQKVNMFQNSVELLDRYFEEHGDDGIARVNDIVGGVVDALYESGRKEFSSLNRFMDEALKPIRRHIDANMAMRCFNSGPYNRGLYDLTSKIRGEENEMAAVMITVAVAAFYGPLPTKVKSFLEKSF